MSQLSSSRYIRLSPPMTYATSDGLYWDKTASQLVLVMGDSIVARIDANGITADLEVSGEARGDFLRRGASAWERVSAKTADAVLVGDGTDVVSTTLANASLKAPKVAVVSEAIAVTGFTDGGATSGTKQLALTIPAGARVLATLIHGITGFAGDTSAVIIVGDGSDTDRYNTGTPNVFATAAAGVDMGAVSGTAFHATAVQPTVTVTTGADFTSCKTNAAGAATLTFIYAQPV